MTSLSVVISDAAIERYAAEGSVGELRDQRHPITLMFHKSRTKGTWYFVYYHKRQKQRTRLGYWPTIKTKAAVAMVPDAVAKLGRSEDAAGDKHESVSSLLNWYLARCCAESFKANTRKAAIESHITHHLLPKLGNLAINEVNKQIIDERLFLPLQAEGLKASTIKHIFYTLKPAFKRAYELGYITQNPLSPIVFGEHITKRLKPKEARLFVTDRDTVLEAIHQQKQPAQLFLMMMILYGTRIGETRLLKWSYIQLDQQRLVIPAAATKTGDSHVLPITDEVKALLSAHKSKGEFVFEHNGRVLTEQQAQSWVKLASGGKWSAHDLRKFARSAWAELGIDYWVAERLLNHKPKGLDAVYIKAGAYEVRLAALNTYHKWLFERRQYAGIGT